MTCQTLILILFSGYHIIEVIEESNDEQKLQTQIYLACLLGLALLPQLVWLYLLGRFFFPRLSFSTGELVLSETEIEELKMGDDQELRSERSEELEDSEQY